MRWKGRRQSRNIEDSRGQGTPRSGRNPFGRGGFRLPSRGSSGGRGGMSFKSMLLMGVVFLGLWAFGIWHCKPIGSIVPNGRWWHCVQF
jgi:predicted metalloprotease